MAPIENARTAPNSNNVRTRTLARTTVRKETGCEMIRASNPLSRSDAIKSYYTPMTKRGSKYSMANARSKWPVIILVGFSACSTLTIVSLKYLPGLNGLSPGG